VAVDGGVARRALGDSGLTASVAGIGGNVFGPPRLDQAQTNAIIAAALDLGVDFIDTANVYGQGQSEEMIGRAIGTRRDAFTIATKFNLRGLGDGDSVASHIRAQAEQSLRKLGSDHIDLYQLHQPRDDVPMAEILAVLSDLVAEGKVRAVGACNFAGWRLAEARQIAVSGGYVAFVTVQNYYHVLARQAEAEVVPYAQRSGLGVLPYHPLAGGFLTGKYRRAEPAPAGTRGASGSRMIDWIRTEENYRALDRLGVLAGACGRTPGELALAWLASRTAVSSVIAGVSSVDQLRSNVAACAYVPDEQTLGEIDRLVAPGSIQDPERPPYLA